MRQTGSDTFRIVFFEKLFNEKCLLLKESLASEGRSLHPYSLEGDHGLRRISLSILVLLKSLTRHSHEGDLFPCFGHTYTAHSKIWCLLSKKNKLRRQSCFVLMFGLEIWIYSHANLLVCPNVYLSCDEAQVGAVWLSAKALGDLSLCARTFNPSCALPPSLSLPFLCIPVKWHIVWSRPSSHSSKAVYSK